MADEGQRLARLLAWRSGQPAGIRWSIAILLFALAVLARLNFGLLHGANPGLTFYPAILITTVLAGWEQALFGLIFTTGLGAYLFVPPRLYLLPVAWLLVGGFNIAIIASLQRLAHELTEANARQRLLFQELQHRVANTLQMVVGTFDVARMRVASCPSAAVALLEDSGARISAAADVHRRLHDPALFERGIAPVLQDAVGAIIDRNTVGLLFDIHPIGLSFDQASTITMLVIEAAHNAHKHVFRHGRGHHFAVALHRLDARHAALTISDDGQGPRPLSNPAASPTLGTDIVRSLVRQLDGTLTVRSDKGTMLRVEFPLRPA